MNQKTRQLNNLLQIFPQGVTGLSLWVLACIMFVFSAVIAYTGILSKALIREIKLNISRFRRGSIKPGITHKDSNDRKGVEPGGFEYYRGVDALLIFVFPLGFLIFNCFYWYYYMKL